MIRFRNFFVLILELVFLHGFFSLIQYLDFADFIEFYDARKESVRKKLMSKLGVTSEPMVEA